MTVATTEGIIFSGQGGDDTLTVESPAGPQTVAFTPGPAIDAGLVQLNRSSGASLIPIEFVDVGTSGNLVFTDINGGRTDTLKFFGTGVDDVFELSVPAPGVDQIDVLAPTLVGPRRAVRVQAPGVRTVDLFGLDGSDSFNVPGDVLYRVNVEGGNPSGGSDSVNVVGAWRRRGNRHDPAGRKRHHASGNHGACQPGHQCPAPS